MGGIQSVSASCFADVLGELVSLTSREKLALEKLEERQRQVRRAAVVQRENEPCHELFVLRKGLMMSYVLLDDGSRQILSFLFPGDFAVLPSVVYRKAPETVTALSDAVVASIDRHALAATAGDEGVERPEVDQDDVHDVPAMPP